jgi:hypothetical protein
LRKDARHINSSHFGSTAPGDFDSLASRQDVKAILFIHDMLPFEIPEYFPRRFALLDRSAALRGHILEVSGLPTSVLRRLLETPGRC